MLPPMPMITPEQWSEIDGLILNRRIPTATKRICEISGLDISDGGEIVFDRYRQLRAERPTEFVCGHDEYWSGFQS